MDPLDVIQSFSPWISNELIAWSMDTHNSTWASATATDVEWDAIALGSDANCKHPKWTPWPFDYTKETCTHCGEERRFIRGRATC